LPYELGAQSALSIEPGGARCAITFAAGPDDSRTRGEPPRGLENKGA
jgi:hypothetical protein